MKKYNVLIAGGSGLIGQSLKTYMIKSNYNVKILSRNRKSKYYWNPKKNELDASILSEIDYVINLCGSKIDKRWTNKVKKEVYTSRINSTKFLIKKINSTKTKIKKYIGASAIGYYEYGKNLKNENSKKGSHFLSDICFKWENEHKKIQNIPICILRIGVVLSKEGGMLNKLLLPFSLNLGSSIGGGSQKISWIHIEDLSKMMIFCLNDKITGTFNAVSPTPVSNHFFSITLAKVKSKYILFPNVPTFVIKIIFGEMSTMILNSLDISSKKIENKGFSFTYSELETALKKIIN